MKYSSQSTIIAKVGDASEFIPSGGRLGRGQAVPITNPRPHQPQNPPSGITPRTHRAPFRNVEWYEAFSRNSTKRLTKPKVRKILML